LNHKTPKPLTPSRPRAFAPSHLWAHRWAHLRTLHRGVAGGSAAQHQPPRVRAEGGGRGASPSTFDPKPWTL